MHQGNETSGPHAPDAAVVKYDRPVRDVLVAARKLIEDPERWTQGQTGRLASGQGCDGTHERAVKFCAYGALVRAHGRYENNQPGYVELSHAVGLPLIDFNDRRTHAEVLAAFDRAIAQCAVGDRDTRPASTERA